MGVPGYDINDGFQNLQPDAKACRESCRELGLRARHFTWLDQYYQSMIVTKTALIMFH